MLKVVLPTAVVALALGFVSGHALWPVRKSERQETASRSNRWRPPPAVGIDGAPIAGEPAPPEVWTVDQVMRAVGDLMKLTGLSKRSEAVNAIEEHIEPADAPELAPRLVALSSDRVVTQLLYVVMSGWSEGDPEAALKFAAKVPNEALRAMLVQQAIHPYAQADLDGAIAFAQGLPQGSLRSSVIDSVLGVAAMNEPKRALALMSTLPAATAQNDTRNVFSTWASHDLDGAVAAAQDMPEGRAKTQAMESVIAEWAQKDPQKALEWAVQHNSERNIGDALQNCFAGAAVERPDLAATYVAKLDDGATRDGIIGTLALRWASENAEAAKKWATSLDGNDRTLALEGMVSGMQYENPSTALDIAKAIDDPRMRSRSMGNVLAVWADREPDAAWKYTQQLDPSPEKDEIVANIVGSLARSNPMAAAEALTDLEGVTGERAVAEVARNWTELDPQAAVRWVERLPAGDTKTRAMSSLASTWVSEDPIAATAWAEQHADENAKREMALIWSTSDPQAATEWAMDHGGKHTDEGMFVATMSTWASNDPRRAAAWATDLPRGESRDAAFAQLGSSVLYDEPEKAMGYVDEITDPKKREIARAQLYASWHSNDPKAAKRWGRGSKYAAMLAEIETGQSELLQAEEVPSCECPPVGAP